MTTTLAATKPAVTKPTGASAATPTTAAKTTATTPSAIIRQSTTDQCDEGAIAACDTFVKKLLLKTPSKQKCLLETRLENLFERKFPSRDIFQFKSKL